MVTCVLQGLKNSNPLWNMIYGSSYEIKYPSLIKHAQMFNFETDKYKMEKEKKNKENKTRRA